MVRKTTNSVTAVEKDISVSLLHPSSIKPRALAQEAIERLAESIRTNGLLSPLIVCLHPDKEGEYMIVSGERRWRAALYLKWNEIPCKVMNAKFSPVQIAQYLYSENELRDFTDADLEHLRKISDSGER